MVEVITEARQGEARERLIEGAWAAYQIGAGEEGKDFGQYLKALGLGTGTAAPRGDTEDRSGDMSAEDAIKKSEAILAMARGKTTE